MNLPTLRQLEYIVSLADTGQFIEAARQCHVSQPALSKQVREAEELLGLALFERTSKGIIATPEGHEIIRRARQLLIDARDLSAAAKTLTKGHQGMIRLGVIPTIAPYALPGFLVKLRHLYPEASVAIHELHTEDLIKALREGQVDLALLAHPYDVTGLMGRDIVFEPFVLVAPVDHRLNIDQEVKLAEISGASLILMKDGHCLRDQAMEICALAGAPPATTVAAASLSTLVRMVESGLGATLLPVSALAAELTDDNGIIARSFGENPPGRTIALQWRATSPYVSWFIDISTALKKHYQTLNAAIDPS